jgi:hypothetical protein
MWDIVQVSNDKHQSDIMLGLIELGTKVLKYWYSRNIIIQFHHLVCESRFIATDGDALVAISRSSGQSNICNALHSP